MLMTLPIIVVNLCVWFACACAHVFTSIHRPRCLLARYKQYKAWHDWGVPETTQSNLRTPATFNSAR